MDPRADNPPAPSHAASSTRRRLVPLLAALPLGGLLTTHSDEDTAAQHQDQRRGRRTRQRNRKHRNNRRNNSNSAHGGNGDGNLTSDPCEVSSDCPANTLCNGGACQACDVCPQGCAFSNLHAAIDSPARPSTIRVCAGTYDPIVIQRSLTLIGAGDGDDESSNSILQGESGFTSVVTITPANAVVTLQGLLITGGNSPEGGGVFNRGALTMTDVTVSGNTANSGGGLYNAGSGVTLAGCSVTGNTAAAGGGLYSGGGPITLQRGTSIRGNSSDNCGGPGPYAG